MLEKLEWQSLEGPSSSVVFHLFFLQNYMTCTIDLERDLYLFPVYILKAAVL